MLPKLLVQIKPAVGVEPKGSPEERAPVEAGAAGADLHPAAWRIGLALLLLVNEVTGGSGARSCAGNNTQSCTSG